MRRNSARTRCRSTPIAGQAAGAWAATASVTLDNSFVGAPPVQGWNLDLAK